MEKDINVILVDTNDNEIGTMEKMEAHRKAKLHRAISVFIINKKGEWLLQRRALTKYHSSGLWSNTCCTHPFPEESNINAAHRRLKYEMGMSTDIEELFSFIYKVKLNNQLTEHELDHIFIGITDEEPTLNPSEVMDWKYISLENLEQDISDNPANYSFWFKHIFNKVSEHIKNNIIK